MSTGVPPGVPTGPAEEEAREAAVEAGESNPARTPDQAEGDPWSQESEGHPKGEPNA